MELQLTDSFDFKLDDLTELKLPEYVERLNPDEVCKKTDRSKLIIAVGTDPSDHKLTLVTGDGKILIFDAHEYCIPPGPSFPYDGGKQIFFKNIDGRWPGPSEGFFADSDWIIEKSVSALTGATLRINYPYENNDK
jgi:hypothetical protein